MPKKGDGIYKRGSSWRLDVVHKGKRYVRTLGRKISRSTAKELAHLEWEKIVKGEAGIGRKPKDISFEQGKEIFLAWVEGNKRPKTYNSCKCHMNRLNEFFAGRQLSEVSPFLLEKYKLQRIKEECPVALNRELSYLKLLFNKCIDWKKFEGRNPVTGVKGIRESQGRTRYLTLDEEARLLGAAKEPLRTVIVLGVTTGLRSVAEALTLKRENVDLENGFLTVEGAYAKNHETVTIPLNQRAREALKSLMAKSQSEYVFTNRDGKPFKSIRTAFTTAGRHANLSGVTPHVLRHTFASRLGDAGVSDGTIQALGRWKEAKMIQRYKHLTEKHLREAVEKIAQEVPPISPPPQERKTRKSLCARSSVG